MSYEVFPETFVSRGNSTHRTHYSFLDAYAATPHMSLDDVGLFPPFSLRQYGSFIFFRHLSEHAQLNQVVRDLWLERGLFESPLELLARTLERSGTTLEDELASCAVHNAAWDYLDGAKLRQIVEEGTPRYGWFNGQFVHDLGPQGDGNWLMPSPGLRPARLGYNLVRLRNPNQGRLTLRFVGARQGTHGNAANFEVTFVREYAERPPSYQSLRLWRGEGSLRQDVGDETALYVVVSERGPYDRRTVGERFDYEFQLLIGPARAGSN